MCINQVQWFRGQKVSLGGLASSWETVLPSSCFTWLPWPSHLCFLCCPTLFLLLEHWPYWMRSAFTLHLWPPLPVACQTSGGPADSWEKKKWVAAIPFSRYLQILTGMEPNLLLQWDSGHLFHQESSPWPCYHPFTHSPEAPIPSKQSQFLEVLYMASVTYTWGGDTIVPTPH